MAFTYIASPYTDDDPAIMHHRYEQIALYTANCLKAGEHVFSPIVHCHDMAVLHNLPRDIKFWKAYDKAMLSSAKELRVVKLAGWTVSKGIAFEISFAEDVGIPVVYVDPALYV